MAPSFLVGAIFAKWVKAPSPVAIHMAGSVSVKSVKTTPSPVPITDFGFIQRPVYQLAVTKSIFTDKYNCFRERLTKPQTPRIISSGDCQSPRQTAIVRIQIRAGERRLDVVEFIEVAKAIGLDPVALIKHLID